MSARQLGVLPLPGPDSPEPFGHEEPTEDRAPAGPPGEKERFHAAVTPKPKPTHERPRRRWFRWVPSDFEQLAKVESCILHFVEKPYIQRTVDGLNTISSVPRIENGACVRRHIVLLHGFGGGACIWLPNFNFLVSEADREPKVATQIHAVDLPGFARSERHPKLQFKDESAALDYLCGALHKWLTSIALPAAAGQAASDAEPPHIDLVGHSFGAYVATNFALRHPDLVNRVVLCDPWGVPPKPDRIEKDFALRYRIALRLFYLGNPFSVLRCAGPWGPSMLPSVRRDFAARWGPLIDDPAIFFDYVFHCNAAGHPTGEQAFQACCTGPVFARRPLRHTLPDMPKTVDLAVLYGARTWMDKAAGREMMEEAARRRGKAVQNSIDFVPHAGHQVNTDNVEGFNHALARELRLTGH